MGEMRYAEALRYGENYLKEHRIPDASVDAWLLMEYCCHMSRAEYLLKKPESMPEPEWIRYQVLLKERGGRTPLQHITGEQEFMGLTFRVNEHVLIPRQDTEILVEEALKVMKPGMEVLDLCTGSGCIIISAKKLGPLINATASDLSAEALEVARQNARQLDAQICFVESDLFENIRGSFDMILSNPPYIPTRIIEQLMEEVRLHDPLEALDGKEDGLYFYRKIIDQSVGYLNPGGWLLFEIGHDQGEAVCRLMKEKEYIKIKVIKDLAGLDRVVMGCRT